LESVGHNAATFLKKKLQMGWDSTLKPVPIKVRFGHQQVTATSMQSKNGYLKTQIPKLEFLVSCNPPQRLVGAMKDLLDE